MFVYVKLLSGFQKTLIYKVPTHLQEQNLINKCILVPLRQKNTSALVVEQVDKPHDTPNYEIKEITGLEPFPGDHLFQTFVEKASALYFTNPLHFYQKLRQFLKKREENIHTSPLVEPIVKNHCLLTEEQAKAAEHAKQSLSLNKFAPMVLHGVTGSGKTEVYKEAINEAIEHGKIVLFLLPEVSLALQFALRLARELPHITVHSFHSATPPAEKKQVWRALLQAKPILIIGVHLPVLLPIANLGLIIIDEEHEAGFEEKKHPKFNSKYLALLRANIYKIPIILGSATPAIQTLYNVHAKGWPLFNLTKRFAGAFPVITTIVLPKEPKRRSSFWISKELELAIAACLKQGKQVIIFLNRRGYSFFVQCKLCGLVVECPSCSVSLTTHQNNEASLSLRCHYCNYARRMPSVCDGCKASSDQFLSKGIGTQQLVEILQRLFPAARIARADLDTTSKKNLWADTTAAFERGDLDILVGTKSVTKGYHFPGVTLVGVIWGDLNAHIPVFNAAETCLQQLIQVAGRAGRVQSESRVIVQIMHDHDMFKFVNEIDYLEFAKQELEVREATWYPPFCRLAQIELKHKNPSIVEKDAHMVAAWLRKTVTNNTDPVNILGPATPAIHKIQNVEARHIFIKAQNFSTIEWLAGPLQRVVLRSSISITIV